MKKNDKLHIFARIIFSILTLSLIIFIFSNSLQNATSSSLSSGRIMNFLNMLCSVMGIRPLFTQEIVRFLAHFCEFGLLGVLSYMTFHFYFIKKLKVSIYSGVLVVLVSVADECFQLFSDGRAFQISDILTDLGGAFLGIAGTFLLVLIIELICRKNRGFKNG